MTKHKRDFEALENRRLMGTKLLALGVSKTEVARQVGVARQTAANWGVIDRHGSKS